MSTWGRGIGSYFCSRHGWKKSLRKKKKAKVQQRRLEEAKGEENPRKILPTRRREERGKNEENK